jgi:hypothetical protein
MLVVSSNLGYEFWLGAHKTARICFLSPYTNLLARKRPQDGDEDSSPKSRHDIMLARQLFNCTIRVFAKFVRFSTWIQGL